MNDDKGDSPYSQINTVIHCTVIHVAVIHANDGKGDSHDGNQVSNNSTRLTVTSVYDGNHYIHSRTVIHIILIHPRTIVNACLQIRLSMCHLLLKVVQPRNLNCLSYH